MLTRIFELNFLSIFKYNEDCCWLCRHFLGKVLMNAIGVVEEEKLSYCPWEAACSCSAFVCFVVIRVVSMSQGRAGH